MVLRKSPSRFTKRNDIYVEIYKNKEREIEYLAVSSMNEPVPMQGA